MATTSENPWKGLFAQTAVEHDTDFFFFDDLANSNIAVNLGYPSTGPTPALPEHGSFAEASKEVEEETPRRISGRKRKAADAIHEQKRAKSSSEEEYEDDEDGDMDVEAKKAAIRKARNRKAAKDFRRRQKKKVEDIMSRNSDLEKRNEELETQLKVAKNENGVMKDQLDYLRSFVSRVMQAALPAMAAHQFPTKAAAGELGGNLLAGLSFKDMQSAMGLQPKSV